MPASRRSPTLVIALVLLMVSAAFAMGIGAKGLLDDDSVSGRSVRGTPVEAVTTPADARAGDSRFELLDEIYDILNRDFVEPDRIDSEGLRVAAINGLIDALNDPHSVYLDKETFRLSSEGISGAFEGIGATVNQRDGAIVIAGTFRGSPAEGAGIRAGDIILTVDSTSTEGWSIQEAVARIRGPRGEVVELGVRHRNGEDELITITRGRIVVPSVQSLQIQNRDGSDVTDLAYIHISQYTDRTLQELRPFLDAIHAAGLTQLIIDVRGNPGGLLTATVDTTGEFLDGGLVLIEVDRDGNRRAFDAARGGRGINLQIAILVNAFSASGAEVMAAALRDHGRAVVIGEQTLGKGTVNIPRRLSDGSVLYVSTARWLTPDGDLIEGIGVIPDIIVEPTDDDFDQRRDVQLFAALDFLRGESSASTPGPTSPAVP